jgi:glycosyltransferase involved in cell wall biosynthesis
MRILFVAMADNVHSARWIAQLRGQGWDIHLFPVETAPLHPALADITVHDALFVDANGAGRRLRLVNDSLPFLRRSRPLTRGIRPARKMVSRYLPKWDNRAWRLAQVIRDLAPDVVHSLEIVKVGHLVWQAREILDGIFPPWLVSNWGSDIYLFGRLAEGMEKIRRVLSACDFYTSECYRDVELARSFGFKGEVVGVVPGAGGFDIPHAQRLRQSGRTSARRTIALKGYQGWAGRALVGLRAIELCADRLQGYRIAIYLANNEVRMAAELVTGETGIPIDIVPPSSHDDILALHGRSRISIGLSISDAISTSLLEAMTMGSFPIQTDTSCAAEWLTDGEGGILVPPNDPGPIADAIVRALEDDTLVDHAAEINSKTVTERLDHSVIRPQVIGMYERVVTVAGGQQADG